MDGNTSTHGAASGRGNRPDFRRGFCTCHPFYHKGSFYRVDVQRLRHSGVESLIFLVSGALQYFRYLNQGLALVLCFVGVKMVISDFYHIPTLMSLGVVVGILAMTMLISYLASLREARTQRLESSGNRLEGSES